MLANKGWCTPRCLARATNPKHLLPTCSHRLVAAAQEPGLAPACEPFSEHATCGATPPGRMPYILRPHRMPLSPAWPAPAPAQLAGRPSCHPPLPAARAPRAAAPRWRCCSPRKWPAGRGMRRPGAGTCTVQRGSRPADVEGRDVSLTSRAGSGKLQQRGAQRCASRPSRHWAAAQAWRTPEHRQLRTLNGGWRCGVILTCRQRPRSRPWQSS